MNKEVARRAVLGEYDRWVKIHPNQASMMGGFLFFRYLQKDKVGPSRFPFGWQQVANRSRLDSRSLEGLASVHRHMPKLRGVGPRCLPRPNSGYPVRCGSRLGGEPVKRRQFITLVGGAAAWPVAAHAQQSLNRIPLVGVLWHAGSAEEEDVYLTVLVKAFNDLGYVEGKNIHLDQRFPAENPELFQKLGQELVDAHPAVLIAITSLGRYYAEKAY